MQQTERQQRTEQKDGNPHTDTIADTAQQQEISPGINRGDHEGKWLVRAEHKRGNACKGQRLAPGRPAVFLDFSENHHDGNL